MAVHGASVHDHDGALSAIGQSLDDLVDRLGAGLGQIYVQHKVTEEAASLRFLRRGTKGFEGQS